MITPTDDTQLLVEVAELLDFLIARGGPCKFLCDQVTHLFCSHEYGAALSLTLPRSLGKTVLVYILDINKSCSLTELQQKV